ncbi:MAG: response regulator [Synechococcales bacterium]|nr:response regulator [Synechococcales bacterium]
MPLNSTHILLIDDNLRLVNLLAMELRDAGYRVSVASSGTAGLQMALNLTPDLIFLDWNLPDIDGVSVCRRLRAAHYPCPIIMMTGKSEQDCRLVCLPSGADAYLVKPFDLDALLAQVAAYQHVCGCAA